MLYHLFIGTISAATMAGYGYSKDSLQLGTTACFKAEVPPAGNFTEESLIAEPVPFEQLQVKLGVSVTEGPGLLSEVTGEDQN